QVEEGVIANARRLTNIGTLRAYIVQYLRQHPGIHQDMTLLVRQLSPTPEGLPLEIYAFTNDTRRLVYEGSQSDIFDHILAMVPQFALRVFQKPAGQDVIKPVREMRLEPVRRSSRSQGGLRLGLRLFRRPAGRVVRKAVREMRRGPVCGSSRSRDSLLAGGGPAAPGPGVRAPGTPPGPPPRPDPKRATTGTRGRAARRR